MRKYQIGVIGSMADLDYSNLAIRFACQLGTEIAKRDLTLVFGAEQDSDSLPTRAAVAAREKGGTTVGVTYEKAKQIWDPKSASIVIPTGLVRGGGRELVQALSCDGIIAIAGGSGTLNEICVAYQADIPVVVADQYGGWSQQLAERYLDTRKRYSFPAANTAKQALEILIKMIQSKEIS